MGFDKQIFVYIYVFFFIFKCIYKRVIGSYIECRVKANR